jgi:hypothetical protein
MIKAIITYSNKLVLFRRFEIEMSVLERPLLQEQGMQVQFQFRDTATGAVKIVCKGLLETYSPWSESPVALTLRALHTLYTEWHESVPAELRVEGVASMQIVVAYANRGTEDTPLTSISLTKVPGTAESYEVLRSVDADASWPLQISSESAVPLGIALKLLAFENSSPIDFNVFPPPPKVVTHADADRMRVVQMSELPDYAVTAFQAYVAGNGAYRQGDAAVPIGRWRSFLRS